ncbi:phage protein Gp27 family protein [Asticcacaulis sp. MM231]|uniref:phage protein Gp27 family protein n=1 Tax=Asticcacaulis sp. MM231 TaxID=3157666 RepID=UPI0032D57410
MQSLASAQKIDADRVVKVRQEMAREAAKAVEKVANQQGLGKDMRNALMEAALGIAT